MSIEIHLGRHINAVKLCLKSTPPQGECRCLWGTGGWLVEVWLRLGIISVRKQINHSLRIDAISTDSPRRSIHSDYIYGIVVGSNDLCIRLYLRAWLLMASYSLSKNEYAGASVNTNKNTRVAQPHTANPVCFVLRD